MDAVPCKNCRAQAAWRVYSLRSCARICVLLVLVVLQASVLAGQAEAGGPTPPRGWFLPVGASASYLTSERGHTRRHSGKLGAELSAVYTRNALWYGGYADATYDFGGRRVWFSVGPEFGSVLLGLDAGAVLVAEAAGASAGFRVRAVGNLPTWPDYSRLQYFVGGGALLSGRNERFLEVGLLFKFGNRVPPRP